MSCNSKMIGTCLNCDQHYCMECSDAESYDQFCSQHCEEEYPKSKEER